jgi:hypothetical protein
MAGCIEPGEKRTVTLDRYRLTLENTDSILWYIDESDGCLVLGIDVPFMLWEASVRPIAPLGTDVPFMPWKAVSVRRIATLPLDPSPVEWLPPLLPPA